MDYKKLGFKAGIEIHNRLATKEKIFCSCPSHFSEKDPTQLVIRRLRTVPGELGETDIAALFEFLRDKTFQYQYFPDKVCLVECDSEPPHRLNPEVIELGLTISKLLKAEIPDEIHIMRKTVIDGSNTGGFQRSAMIGMDGTLQTSKGPVRIANISVEEESSGIIQNKGNTTLFRLDRLGIPLVEIGTYPDVKDPEHAQEIAEKLGLIVRSTGKSQRGIGTIRQDVNVSIAGGNRIEVKGMQELGMIKETIELEVQRQFNLLEIKKSLKKRKASVSKIEDVTNVFRNTKSNLISSALGKGEKIYGLSLKGFSGLLNSKISGKRRFVDELLDYAKSHGVRGLIDSEEDLSKYKLEDEFKKLGEKFKAKKDDVLLIITGSLTAMQAVKGRAEAALREVPKETRVANPDGTTRYARPLPGGERMYPETDCPPIEVTSAMLRLKIPETWEVKQKRFSKILSAQLSEQIIRSEYLDLFEKFHKKYDPALVANTFLSTIKDLRRSGINTYILTEEHFKELFGNVGKKISKEAIPEVLSLVCQENITVSDAIKRSGFKVFSEAELKEFIRKILKENENLVKENKVSALMGEVMRKIRGKADGKTVKKVLLEEMK